MNELNQQSVIVEKFMQQLLVTKPNLNIDSDKAFRIQNYLENIVRELFGLQYVINKSIKNLNEGEEFEVFVALMDLGLLYDTPLDESAKKIKFKATALANFIQGLD